MNPRVTVMEQLTRREMALMRTLRMGGRIAGDMRDNVGSRMIERKSREIRSELVDDGLLPVITGVSLSAVNQNGQTYVALSASVDNPAIVRAYCFKTGSETPASSDSCFKSFSTWLITPPSNETTYYLWVKDGADRVSASFTRVVAPFAIRNITVSRTDYDTVKIVASAANSVVAAYCWTTRNTAPTAEDAECVFQSSPNFEFQAPSAVPIYYVWGKDNLGNLTAGVSSQTQAGLCSPTGVAASERSALPTVCVSTSLGEFVLELEKDRAPTTVTNFLKYVNDGFYSGTVFHRIMSNFMVQGGGFNTDGSQKAATYSAISLESPTTTGLSNLTGAVAMARTTDANSATSQFFINVMDNFALNGTSSTDGYAVFGRVISGMDTSVQALRNVPVHTASGASENSSPDNPPIIYWAYQLK